MAYRMTKAPRDRARSTASRVLKRKRPAATPRAQPGTNPRSPRHCRGSPPPYQGAIDAYQAPGGREDLYRDDEREERQADRAAEAEAAAQGEGEEEHRDAVGELYPACGSPSRARVGSKMPSMNAPDSRRRLARKPRSDSKRRSRVFLAELRRQCRLANKADRRDNWRQYLYLPE